MRKYYQRRLPENPSKDYYYIMRETPNTTSLLLEYGFIDNPNDVVKLQNYLLDYVEAVVKAVANYIGVPYIAPDGALENTYTVQSGDTLYKIANQYGVTVAEIMELNNLGTTILTVGEQILIPNKSQDTTTTYTVQSGDSLYKIANEYGVTVDEIITANNLKSTKLQIGQVLVIPTGTIQPTLPNNNYITYTVKPGDSLYKIANNYNTTVNAIKELNNLKSNNLSIGQQLKIPSSSNDTSYTTYTVKKGDSLWLIANNFNTTVDNIKRLNNLTSNNLSIGQQLKISR